MALTEKQTKQYNSYRAEGMSVDRALRLTTKGSSTELHNPSLEKGVDNILFGKKSLASSVAEGVKEAATSGFKTIAEDTRKFGPGFALLKSPLSLAAGVGRGVGKIAGGILETADDLTGEVFSGALQPVVQKAIDSKFGQDIIQSLNEFDEKGRGIPGDIFDSLDLLGVTALAKSGIASSVKASIKNSAKAAIKQSGRLAGSTVKKAGNIKTSLADFLPTKQTAAQVGDVIVEKSLKGLEQIKKIPQKLSDSAKRSIDRRIERIAASDPKKAFENLIILYKKGVVPGVKKKNKTIKNIKGIEESVKRAVPSLAKKYADVNDLESFATAINTEKKEIFRQIKEGLKKSSTEGKLVDTKNIVDELDILAKSERAELSQELKNAIEKARANLIDEKGVPKKVSPLGAQDIIADLNAQLQSFYRGSTAGSNADVIVDNLVVNNLRKSVDDLVEDLGDGSFKDLKGKYRDLKQMEDDVVHRAIFESQKGGGLADLTDILSAGDIAAGTINPVFLAKGAGQFFTKEILKSLSDKNELIRQMFLYGRKIREAAKKTVKAKVDDVADIVKKVDKE